MPEKKCLNDKYINKNLIRGYQNTKINIHERPTKTFFWMIFIPFSLLARSFFIVSRSQVVLTHYPNIATLFYFTKVYFGMKLFNMRCYNSPFRKTVYLKVKIFCKNMFIICKIYRSENSQVRTYIEKSI